MTTKTEELHVALKASSTTEQRRKPGLIQGGLGDEFFDPLSEEELAAWEGKNG
jgi:hypothetical protein